jgi:predicted permease
MQAASAPATALILIARTYHGNTNKVGATMLFAYCCCIIAIPFWVSMAVKIN